MHIFKNLGIQQKSMQKFQAYKCIQYQWCRKIDNIKTAHYQKELTSAKLELIDFILVARAYRSQALVKDIQHYNHKKISFRTFIP